VTKSIFDVVSKYIQKNHVSKNVNYSTVDKQ
jgi:hypothetical protein